MQNNDRKDIDLDYLWQQFENDENFDLSSEMKEHSQPSEQTNSSFSGSQNTDSKPLNYSAEPVYEPEPLSDDFTYDLIDDISFIDYDWNYVDSAETENTAENTTIIDTAEPNDSVSSDKTNANGSSLQKNIGKALAIAAMLVLSSIFISSGNKMTLDFDILLSKDTTAVFESSASVLMSSGLDKVYNMPKIYILPKSDDPAPKPDMSKFSKITDDERQNSNGQPINYYKDDTIEVKCWQETIPAVGNSERALNFHFAEVWIQHPSQFKRKLVDDTISNKKVAYPYITFAKTNGVVGMTADYCAHRSYGTIVHFGEIKRTTKNLDKDGRLDLLIFDKDGNLSSMNDKDFVNSELYGSKDVLFTFAFGPVLVDDYEVTYNRARFGSYPVGELNEDYPRAAIGQFGYDKHYLLCTLDWTPNDNFGGKALDIATVMQQKGVRFAYNLDGGQTSTMLFLGVEGITKQKTATHIFNDVAYNGRREVSDVLYFATAIPNE